MIREILTAPHPVLAQTAKPVDDVAQVQTLIDDMLETLYATENGIGLAAPQVGESLAVVVIDLSEDQNDPLILINPSIDEGDGSAVGPEACLSIPGYSADVERFAQVTVNALDRDGNPISVTRDDFLAVVMQHEIDHLKGTLFIDHLSALKRNMALKKVKKMRR
ncbi:peptide deformylase [Bacterioplanes sanyensis]|uniref:Peptide deformylase n=1 Tax=Bacterioplanes sanyensis TaxID=1249553 RepID=A0A222FL12_9GAMM|nr:peptide deformylase [Bacterioplanes sanyensis]ASP39061.1 peptide deformylase [Bacterioplanes sanyensis]